MSLLGIDFGGSFIKSAYVYTNGMYEQLDNIPTPQPSKPENVFSAIKPLVTKEVTTIGMAIPCAVKNNRALTSTNVDAEWQSIDLQKTARDILGVNCTFINDADAAAVAEMAENIQIEGLTILLTFGTGIGAAMIYNGTLIPNMEFGRMPLRYMGISSAELYAAGRIKTESSLSWQQYARRLNVVLEQVNDLFQPDHIIIGGGITDGWAEFGSLLESTAPVHKAILGNLAGVIGAAKYADGFAN